MRRRPVFGRDGGENLARPSTLSIECIADTDSDGDGLSDLDEVHGSPATDPLNPDTDGDGYTDSEELTAGTNPVDPNSNPIVLVGYWPADEGSRTIVANAGGDSALDGTLGNGSWATGKSGAPGDSAFELNGTRDGNVEVAPTGLTFGRITITGWVNGTPTGDWTGLIQARNGAGPPIGIGFRGNTGQLTYTWNDNNGNTYNFNSGLTVPQNEWAFVALVLDPSRATLYLGTTGAAATLTSATNAIPHIAQANDLNPWNFGIDACCGDTRNWDGLMDDISIWNGTLTEAQLESLWDGSKTPLTLFGAGQKTSFRIAHKAAGDELVISWDSQAGKVYNVLSEVDPSSLPKDWPVYGALQDLPATPPTNSITIAMPAETERYFVIEEFNAPPLTVFADEFESGQGGWTTGNDDQPGTDWQVGAPTVGPGDPVGLNQPANSGSNCLGTDLDAPYVTMANTWARSPAIDLSTASAATLSYFNFVDIEQTFDRGQVRLIDASDNSEIAVLKEPVDGLNNAWEEVTIPLPAAALGKSVIIEFRLITDEFDAAAYAGWFIDDVLVTKPF